MFIRHPYNYDRDEASLACALTCTDPSRARQEFKSETEINAVLAKFNITGQIDLNPLSALQGDFSDIPDYRTLQDRLREADEAFKALPAEVRRTFHNDPAEFVDYVSDPDNIETIRKLGLAEGPQPVVFNLKDVIDAIKRGPEPQPMGKPLPES